MKYIPSPYYKGSVSWNNVITHLLVNTSSIFVLMLWDTIKANIVIKLCLATVLLYMFYAVNILFGKI